MLANVWAIARNTVEDSIRKRIVVVFLILAVLTLGVATAIRHYTVANRAELLGSSQMFVILIFGALIAITTAVFLIPTEIERRTIYSVLAKPVQRWEFFVGKFLGGSLSTMIVVAIMGVVLLIVLAVFVALPPPPAFAVTPSAPSMGFGPAMADQCGPLFVGCAAIILQLVLVTAIATYLSLFLTATVNFSVTTFIWIVGSLQWVIAALANRQDQGLVIVPWVLKIGYFLTPHFYDLNTLGGLVVPEVGIKIGLAPFTVLILAYSMLYLFTVLTAGIISFERKEV